MRKEINNEITKEIDEDTSEVKSSSVVKWEENFYGFPLRRETNNKEVIGFLLMKRNRNLKPVGKKTQINYEYNNLKRGSGKTKLTNLNKHEESRKSIRKLWNYFSESMDRIM